MRFRPGPLYIHHQPSIILVNLLPRESVEWKSDFTLEILGEFFGDAIFGEWSLCSPMSTGAGGLDYGPLEGSGCEASSPSFVTDLLSSISLTISLTGVTGVWQHVQSSGNVYMRRNKKTEENISRCEVEVFTGPHGETETRPRTRVSLIRPVYGSVSQYVWSPSRSKRTPNNWQQH